MLYHGAVEISEGVDSFDRKADLTIMPVVIQITGLQWHIITTWCGKQTLYIIIRIIIKTD